MQCQQTVSLLSAWLDGELPADQAEAVEAHLATCAACRAEADALRWQNFDLRRAFAQSRQTATSQVIERTLAALQSETVAPSSSAEPLRKPFTLDRRLRWAVAVGAGFVLAMLVSSWSGDNRVSSATPVADLVVATGPIEVRPAGAGVWSALPAGASIPSGADVRTGPGVQCELLTRDGSQVRLNALTQVCMSGNRDVKVDSGQMFLCSKEGGAPFCVQSGDARLSSQAGKFDVVCSPNSTVLTVAEGSCAVKGKQGAETIDSGQRAEIVNGTVTDKQVVHDMLTATRWVNDIMVRKSHDDPELAARVHVLLAELGASKMSHLNEAEIRALGDSSVSPLLHFIQTPESKQDLRRRISAARIVGDLAPPRNIPDLILLLTDDDPEVRVAAEKALTRLTGLPPKLTPSGWATSTGIACEAAQRQWQTWWEENRARFPAAAMGGEK